MFTMTKDWLWQYYGSKGSQVSQTDAWLRKHGKDFPEEKIPVYRQYKHLSEYQPNNLEIVDVCLSKCGEEFISELDAHKWVNIQRFPQREGAYTSVLADINPSTILELGVGGDSAISTAIFLAHVEAVGGSMISVDMNPLGSTWERYKKYPFWKFIKNTSKEVLQQLRNQWSRFDMIFIDTKPTYEETSIEMAIGSELSNNLVLDDAYATAREWDDMVGKLGAWREFMQKNDNWEITHYPPLRNTAGEGEKENLVGCVAWVKKKPSKLLKRY